MKQELRHVWQRLTGVPRRAAVALLLLLTILQLGPVQDGQAAAAPQADAVPNQLIVGFQPFVAGAARDAVISKYGSRTLREFEGIHARLIELPSAAALVDSVRVLEAEPGVRYAEPNYIYRTTRAPNDPYYGPYQWGLNNMGQGAGTPGADISAEQAWNTTTGSRSIVVGVVDTGIDASHPDLSANLWSAPAGWNLFGCGPGTQGYDAVSNDCVPDDAHGHGTHVAGTIGASGNNGQGVTGVNWNVSIMPLKALDSSGSGTTTDAIWAIEYAVQAKARGVNVRVLNNSWGGPSYSTPLYDEINYAGSYGILFVAAAGNASSDNDTTPMYPASYDLPNIISVAATDNRDNLAWFSNYGARSVDIGAPGQDILSTLPTYPTTTYYQGNYLFYGFLDGTSMAAPHVAGAAALVLSAPGLGGLSVAQLKDRLLSCGDPDPALAGRTVTGKRLNVYRAIVGCAAPAPTYTLALSSTAGGAASASPPGPTYTAGTAVTLTATAYSGYYFSGWTLDGAPAGSANPGVLTMNANHTLIANFAPLSGWSPWTSQGGVLSDSPSAAGFNGRVYVFAKGADRALYVKSSADGRTYTGWQNLGGVLSAAPAATSANGRLYVFAKGADDALYVKSSTDGATFTDWNGLGGVLSAPPAAASVNGTIYVFVKGADNALYMMRSTDGVSYAGWFNLGGVLTAAPGATNFAGQVYVFAKGADNALYEKHSPDGVYFTGWNSYGGVLSAAPAAASYTPVSGPETLYTFAKGADDGLYERHTTDGVNWTDWQGLGGQLVGPPTAAGVNGVLYTFVRWSDNALWERRTQP